MALFNVRVYGLLINERNEILLSDEQEYGMQFTKFPGGGLELGEGLIDGLKREFMEECNARIEVTSHFYTTDFYVRSAFNDTQVISVYYKVKNLAELQLNFKDKALDFEIEDKTLTLQAFRWVPLNSLSEDDVTFPVDKHVIKLLKQL